MVRQLARRVLKAQIEKLLLKLTKALSELGVIQLSQL
jgi:hypothetical protein